MIICSFSCSCSCCSSSSSKEEEVNETNKVCWRKIRGFLFCRFFCLAQIVFFFVGSCIIIS